MYMKQTDDDFERKQEHKTQYCITNWIQLKLLAASMTE